MASVSLVLTINKKLSNRYWRCHLSFF